MKNRGIQNCHCNTFGGWGESRSNRSGGSRLPFVPSWSCTLVHLNTTPYQHWPPLTLRQASTLVLHCCRCWEAPRWHPMRHALVVVADPQYYAAAHGTAVSLCSLTTGGQLLRRSLHHQLVPSTHITLESRDYCKCKTSGPDRTPGTCGSGVG